MYVIKMDEAKTLVVTKYASIYKGEKNADAILFLLPKLNGTTDLSWVNVFLRYVSPDGSGHAEELELNRDEYNGGYYQYQLPVGGGLTAQSGEVELWLKILSTDSETVLITSRVRVEILESKEIETYLPEETKSQLDSIEEKIAKLVREKADGLAYDSESRRLQMTAENEPIGDVVVVPGDGYADEIKDAVAAAWSDMTEVSRAASVNQEEWSDM